MSIKRERLVRDYGPVEVVEWIGVSGCRMSRLLDERVRYTCMVLRRSLDTQGGSRAHFSKPQSELNLEDFRRGVPSGFQSQHISENCVILHASSS